MKIPKYIMEKLQARCIYGDLTNKLDCQIHKWLRSKGIEIDANDLKNELIMQNTILLITEPFTLRDNTIEYIESQGERKWMKNIYQF